MIAPRLQRELTDPFRKRINHAPSPVVAVAVPWVSIAFASLSPTWPLFASSPVMPPLGFLMLLAWRQIRPGLLPVWAGLPLGLIDDLYSGQPLGSAILLWSVAMLVLEAVEARFPWRSFLHEWFVASAMLIPYLLLTALLAKLSGGGTPFAAMLPQALATLLIYPLVGRLVAWLDRARLVQIKKLR